MTQNQTMEQAMYLTAEDLGYTPGVPTVNLYDFDGVLASPFEEALFTLPNSDKDNEFIRKAGVRYDIDFFYESQRSQRYIAMQATMLDMGVPISTGPIFDQVEGPFYILTARCDRFAIARMHNFLVEKKLKPVKIMHLDHLPKGEMIKVLLDRHQGIHFRFWDDNPGHIVSARLLRDFRLQVNHVDNDMKPYYTMAQDFYENQILDHIL